MKRRELKRRPVRLSTGLIFLGLLLGACGGSTVTQPDELIGSYKAVIFVVPGELDNGIDILAEGGMLSVSLTSGNKMTGHLRIPPNTGAIYPQVDTAFIGTYTLGTDTIYFHNTGTLLDNPYLFFLAHADTLETSPAFSPRGYTRIVLLRE